MALQQKLAVKQGQTLVMTPQLSQSIKLLALSNIELTNFVEDEMERNPFLEKATPDRRDQQQTPTEINSSSPEDLTQFNELEISAKSISENLGSSLENVYPDDPDFRSVTKDNAVSNEDQSNQVIKGGLQLSNNSSVHDQQVADYTAQTLSLRDHLLNQLATAGTSTTISALIAELIDNLDASGYLQIDIDEMSTRLNCPISAINEAVEVLQTFEPTGVGARDLGECLALQLRENNHLDPAMAQILDNLDLLAKRDFAALKRLTGLDIEDLHDCLSEIRRLDPKPGTAFEDGPVQHIVPDVYVKEASDGSWNIELNSETLPRVLVNNTYAAQVSSQMTDNDGLEFLSQCLQNASWLTKSLEQRAQTILKVTKEIVKQQDAFLLHGIQHLRPLTLRDVADAIEMHESSVSRVTSNKYMMTNRGLFELKYFFTTSIASTTSNDGHSAESVRDRIRSLIDGETSNSILSDDAIVDCLRASGVDIARRTIAKYRDAMNIPSSVQRRREKRALEQIGSRERELNH